MKPDGGRAICQGKKGTEWRGTRQEVGEMSSLKAYDTHLYESVVVTLIQWNMLKNTAISSYTSSPLTSASLLHHGRTLLGRQGAQHRRELGLSGQHLF